MGVAISRLSALPVVRTVRHGGIREQVITGQAAGGADGSVGHVGGTTLCRLVFGADGDAAGGGLARPFRASPAMHVRANDPGSGHAPGGWQAIAVSGAAAAHVQDVTLDGHLVGRTYGDDDAEYCYLAGVFPDDVGRSRAGQARSCLERIERALGQAGMGFDHVVRTWLFLDRLLDWYDTFNAVRNAFFRERGVFGRCVPASTGIGAANDHCAALVAGALAIKPKAGARMRVFPVPSPLQCPAIDYRSAFSRAVEVERAGGLRQLYVSGTASIAPDGTSAHDGDPVRQIELTMRVVEELLHSRNMTWADATRMVAYFADPDDVEHFHAWRARREWVDPPVVCVHATVCRDDLLFELELDAATDRPAPTNGRGS